MKILVLSGYSQSLVNFRGDMIEEMVKAGHTVITASPEDGYDDDIRALGATPYRLTLNRNGMNPLSDFKYYKRVKAFLKEHKPDLVLSYLIKPVIYGSLAARKAGVKNIYSMVTGLGYFFTNPSLKARLLRMPIVFLYRRALKACRNVFFQNRDDLGVFVDLKITTEDKCVITNGSGVNIERFVPTPLPEENRFLIIGRILRDKGVMEYLEAARKVQEKYPDARFDVVGPIDTNPSALQEADLAPYLNDNIRYLGSSKDVREHIERCRVYVLPSYREGTPRTVLEAMAMQRAVITTNAPGCKETVVDGDNGFLVPVKDSDALAEKMIYMIEHPDEVERMAQRSLEICREKFDVRSVNKKFLETMKLN